jgi:hypothetical protein
MRSSPLGTEGSKRWSQSTGIDRDLDACAANDAWVVPGVAAGVIGGMALGAVAANPNRSPYYDGFGADYDDCWVERRPVDDEYGEIIGRRRVRVCR